MQSYISIRGARLHPDPRLLEDPLILWSCAVR